MGDLSTHRDFVIEFARAKKTPYFEIPLGSVWANYYRKNGVPIADVLTVRPSYTKFNIDIFECKVSRGDLLNDIRSEKYKKYLPYCNRFYFVVPRGLTDKEEIPEECGLILKSERSFYTRKSAIARYPELNIEMLMALIFFKGKTDKNLEHRRWLSYKDSNELKKLGKKINIALNEYDHRQREKARNNTYK